MVTAAAIGEASEEDLAGVVERGGPGLVAQRLQRGDDLLDLVGAGDGDGDVDAVLGCESGDRCGSEVLNPEAWRQVGKDLVAGGGELGRPFGVVGDEVQLVACDSNEPLRSDLAERLNVLDDLPFQVSEGRPEGVGSDTRSTSSL